MIRRAFLMILIAFLLISPCGCQRSDSGRIQGYVEGEYLYIAAPVAGPLESLYVDRGATVQAGEPLFALDGTPQRAAREEAEKRLAQARANREDARKGQRPSEIESLVAQLRQAQAALTLSERELARQEQLARSSATTEQEYERARTLREQDRQRVARLEADLKTAHLGARPDQIAAAEAVVRAQEATLARAQWDLDQTRQSAPQKGLIFDVFYRPGEWVAAGRPVVALLPPANIKVRAFVPEPRLGAIAVGTTVQVRVDGMDGPLAGRVSFISPRAEFTPPVIYSRESRSKLVFLVEAVFDPAIAEKLHPGQPVDVQFGP